GIGARIIGIVDPALDLLERHLRVELDGPGALPEPERLRARLAPRELLRVRGHVEVVPVPLERIEAARQPSEHRVALAALRQLRRIPADLRLPQRADARARSLRKQLRAETDSEHRRPRVDEPQDQLVLLTQPGMQVL